MNNVYVIQVIGFVLCSLALVCCAALLVAAEQHMRAAKMYAELIQAAAESTTRTGPGSG